MMITARVIMAKIPIIITALILGDIIGIPSKSHTRLGGMYLVNVRTYVRNPLKQGHRIQHQIIDFVMRQSHHVIL